MLDSLDFDAPAFDDARLEELLAVAKQRSARRRALHRRRTSVSALAAALVAVVALYSLTSFAGGGQTAKTWKLVANVTQASWQEVFTAPVSWSPFWALTCPRTPRVTPAGV